MGRQSFKLLARGQEQNKDKTAKASMIFKNVMVCLDENKPK